jgi:hypothetical protein
VGECAGSHGRFSRCARFPWVKRIPEVYHFVKSSICCERDEVVESRIYVQGWELLPRVAPKVSRGATLKFPERVVYVMSPRLFLAAFQINDPRL